MHFLRQQLPLNRLLHRRAFCLTAVRGRVAAVTGAAQGIGRAIALRLASDGFDVAVNDVPAAESKLQEVATLISESGKQALVCPTDVSVDAGVRQLIDSTAQHLGGLDVMVANAGVCLTKTIADMTVEDWDRIFSINARGMFLCYKYAAEQMLKQGGGGRIIGASSIAGKAGVPGLSAYCATKFAVRGLTQSVAQELAPYGITVNAYAPGLVETNMLTYLRSVTTNNNANLNIPINALGVDGQPDDVAGLVSYLASPQSRFLTGQTITIDGGCVYD